MSLKYDAALFDLFGTLVDDGGNAMPGAHACLSELAGARWAIVTSCGERFARTLIAAAKLPLPQILVTGDDVLENKPAPDCYLRAAGHFGIEPARALVIEDSLDGIRAGRGAGMDVVAVLRGRGPAFAQAATFSVADLTKLRLLVNGAAIELDLPELSGL